VNSIFGATLKKSLTSFIEAGERASGGERIHYTIPARCLSSAGARRVAFVGPVLDCRITDSRLVTDAIVRIDDAAARAGENGWPDTAARAGACPGTFQIR